MVTDVALDLNLDVIVNSADLILHREFIFKI